MESGELAIAAVAFIGVCFFLLKYIVGVFNGADRKAGGRNEKENIRSASEEEKQTTNTTGHHQQQQSLRKRVGGSNHSNRKSQAANLQHPWLVSTLKGHEGPVLDLSFSSNGKYLVYSSQGDRVVSESHKEEIIISSSSSNSSSPVSSTSSSPYLGRSKKKGLTGLSRRQKKNRKSKMASNNAIGSNSSLTGFKSKEELDWQLQLTMHLEDYLLTPEDLKKMGYPIVECGEVMVYKEEMPFKKKAAAAEAAASALAAARSAASALATVTSAVKPTRAAMTAAKTAAAEAEKAASAAAMAATALTTAEAEEAASIAASSAALAKSRLDALDNKSFDVNAREFVPHISVKNMFDSNCSSESGGENDSDDSGYARTIEEKKCVRCSSKFRIDTENCEYLSKEKCVYHWGKLLKPWPGAHQSNYTCCNGAKGSKGCSTGRLHVWNGISEGVNGPFYDFVTLRPATTEEQRNNPGIFAIDCEMCYTTAGMELARVTVVDHNGKLLVDEYVQPKHEIICYNSRFSGITAEHMKPFGPSTTFKRVMHKLEKYMCAESILVGHGLDGDLRSLRLIHTRCVDTAFVFPHSQGLPMRRALRHLVSTHLHRNIQTGSEGHSSFEDAKATMDLLLWHVKKNACQVW